MTPTGLALECFPGRAHARTAKRASDRPKRSVRRQGSLYWPEGGLVLREMHDRKQPITRFEPTATDAGVEVRVALAGYATRGRDAAVTGTEWHPAGPQCRVRGRIVSTRLEGFARFKGQG